MCDWAERNLPDVARCLSSGVKDLVYSRTWGKYETDCLQAA